MAFLCLHEIANIIVHDLQFIGGYYVTCFSLSTKEHVSLPLSGGLSQKKWGDCRSAVSPIFQIKAPPTKGGAKLWLDLRFSILPYPR